MYILQRLIIVSWIVGIAAMIKAIVWMWIYLYEHAQRVAEDEEHLAKHPEIMHWEEIGKRWMIISIWIVVAAFSYLIIMP